MDSRREDTKYHKCELLGERVDVVTSFIDAGIFINTRRRLKRYNYFLETLKEVRLYTGFSNYLFLVIKSILNMISFLVVLTIISYRILREFSVYKNKTAGQFTASVLEVVMMVGHGYHSSELLFDKLISIFLIFCGFVIHLLVLVYAMEIWYKFYSCENMQNTVYDAVDAFIRYKALPVGNRNRIFLYLNFKYQRKYYKESTIVRIISDALRREILVRISRESTQSVILFNHLPESILEKLSASLSCEIYMPGDVIIKAGMFGRSMFFILAGTVVVKTPQGKEVCYLRDGAHFGEISLVVNVARVATVVVVTPCQVFRLNRHQFLSVVRHYPDLLKQIHTQALERYADTTTLHMDGPELTDRSELIQVTDTAVENRAPE
ncbi:potassium/sodium hyperpolarization-activated cyclic nucleotide-gated channel 2-like [Sitophilus oryzae]|uniref:Potassium/sodium hyperpolarization-activated cyclic nucleotide-gated channel 2-like n=1 Tax=Sitophilus oryzae TaxID=7048 RepID=A0A6J2YQG8_SITOR|nr:potassium/sodium hyperpolarization-activated cyclic nucleotide-gated channel 2-like [Sitophilus oryzae]